MEIQDTRELTPALINSLKNPSPAESCENTRAEQRRRFAIHVEQTKKSTLNGAMPDDFLVVSTLQEGI